jgi:hypothetical protein
VHSHSYDFYKIEFRTPSLRTFSFTGKPYQKLSGSSLAYVKHLDIDVEMLSARMEIPHFRLSWLLKLSYTNQ